MERHVRFGQVNTAFSVTPPLYGRDMKVNNILVYGDLLRATDRAEAAGRDEPPDPYDNATLAPLFRAVARASAEILLSVADSAHPLRLMSVHDDLVGLAYLRLLDEVDAVLADPVCLRSHPELAHLRPRRELLAEWRAAV